jgi:hypothetical protein
LRVSGYRDVFRGVQDAEPKVRFFFADARISNEDIMRKVRDDIPSCDVGLYEVTFRNPNVMMESSCAITCSTAAGHVDCRGTQLRCDGRWRPHARRRRVGDENPGGQRC